ncbi:molybdopterin guanine dinucleotide-containing S/N-oxide reductase [Helicobacter sp. 11S02629-2]|uniref:molybdopterin guanine dinucleotide-containing S/N-oxide reductase n=1 Tax=Helicobacter sp. 11S02629-2 TaxID=1476195 RepID=UPI000BA5995D|nr:molybdopterin guanine dinucleotide-containing S/N-oxide reductase [Helicobacter sp. 11S02629-2]PAF42520.1 trimethylamine N-oxide reductase I catalytic subunit [Helicobacter sp. 11S02629-2]
MGISRRNVLKLSALFVLAPLAPKMLSAADSKQVMSKADNMKYLTKLVKNGEVFTGAHWGPMKVTIKDGKIVKSEAGVKRKVHNPLQDYIGDLVYAKSRVKYPMVRKSYLEDPTNPKPELRGNDEWVRVSYKKALDLIEAAMRRTYKEKGPTGIFAGSYGWHSSGNVHNAQIVLQRFMAMAGGFTGIIGDYSTAASQVIMPHIVGSLEVYDQQTVWPIVLEHSKVVVIWGSNSLVTLRNSHAIGDDMGADYLVQLKDKGKRVIVIDPVHNETAKTLEAQWIAPVPNTDVALMLGIMHTMYTTGKYDKNFIETYTEGFNKFLPYLLGKSDGVVKDAKWAKSISGVDEATIKDLAKTMFENTTMLMSGWGMQRAHHGEQPHWALVTLASMIGQIGKPGGGFGLCYHTHNGGVPRRKSVVVGGMNTGGKGATMSIPVARIADAILNPGKTIDFNGRKITYPDIDMIYWCGGNPIVHQQNLNKTLKAWRKVNTIVIHEGFWTSSARQADIVMPTTTTYERNDIAMIGLLSNMYLGPMKACVAPLYESKDDYTMFSDLAKRFGIYKEYTWDGKSDIEWVKAAYNASLKQAKPQHINMPSFEEFWEKNEPIEFAHSEIDDNYVRYAEFIEDPILNPLGTPSGKIEIYSETIASFKYDDCPPHPSWLEPVEWLGMKNKPAEFHMVSPHPRDRLHSQLAQTKLRDTYAINGREPIWINEEDAKEKGIKNGDIVRVFNARGETLAGAYVTKDIARHVVRLEEGGWYDPVEPGKIGSLDNNGTPNILTIDMPTSKLASGNISHTALVNVEKYKGKLTPIVVYEEPKKMKV